MLPLPCQRFSAPRHRSIHPVRARSEYANNKIVVSRRADRGGKSNGCIVVAVAAAEEEKSGAQSGWKIASERDSEIYFGNWRGLMDFAGTLLLLFLWKTIPIPCPFLLHLLLFLPRTSRKAERGKNFTSRMCSIGIIYYSNQEHSPCDSFPGRLPWWQRWDTMTLIIVIATVLLLLVAVIIICIVIICICRKRRRQDKCEYYHCADYYYYYYYHIIM